MAGRVAAHRIMHDPPSDRVKHPMGRFNFLDAADVADLADQIRAAGEGGGVAILDTSCWATLGVASVQQP